MKFNRDNWSESANQIYPHEKHASFVNASVFWCLLFAGQNWLFPVSGVLLQFKIIFKNFRIISKDPICCQNQTYRFKYVKLIFAAAVLKWIYVITFVVHLIESLGTSIVTLKLSIQLSNCKIFLEFYLIFIIIFKFKFL